MESTPKQKPKTVVKGGGYQTALTKRILACTPGNFPWDNWERDALKAGVSRELATLGRAVMREASQHGWPSRIKAQCGLYDHGKRMLSLALNSPQVAEKRWNDLLTPARRGKLF